MIEYLTRVSDSGLLPPGVSKQIRKQLSALAGRRVWVRITPASGRSIQQNRYLHLLFTIASKSLIELTGDSSLTKDTLKEMAKFRFLKSDVVDKRTGEVIGERLGETHKLSKDECYEFTQNFIGWMQDGFNIHLPLPGEQQGMEYE